MVEKKESFSDLLEQSFEGQGSFEGKVVKGIIVSLQSDVVVVDVGLKSEGRIPLSEFQAFGLPDIRPGDEVSVFVERLEDRNGDISLSLEKARKEEIWSNLEKAFADGTSVEGAILGRVKGGVAVDLAGTSAFLPSSQIDTRLVSDISSMLDVKQMFKVIKMDKSRNNIVVSRRAVIEESLEGAREEVLSKLSEGKIMTGVVKNITDYGAFVDLGGIDGLLHAIDMSWKRVGHPSDVVSVGQTLDVQILKFNPETRRISLGIKQLQTNPWTEVEKKYIVGNKYVGTVTNVAEYGAFIELEPGIEGLIYVTEMSWIRRNAHAHQILSKGQQVEVMILDVDSEKRRMSLSLKQCRGNPWEEFAKNHPVGSIVEGTVRNATEFGLFVGVSDQLDGMVHMGDISWTQRGDEALKTFEKGQKVHVKILDIDFAKERINLGIKQLEDNPTAEGLEGVRKGDIVTCTVQAVNERGIEVLVHHKIVAFIKNQDLSSERSQQRKDLFAVGERVDAKVISVDATAQKLSLSVRAREVDEEKKVLAEYGSIESGASLGEILGEAIRKKKGKGVG
ncbi:30S ribosomal protein S1 [Alphaproteobacteria bacterium]|nr:30S ribosomal protein S1 [Alphaproteobacteria bacterium]GHS99746.1 30S ribosomal protein S1 [Alphaproteobacteria bacterium]